MRKIKVEDLPVAGLPLYEMQKLFQVSRPCREVSFSVITLLPGKRVPVSGDGFHDADEYSFFLEGEVYTVSGEWSGICGKGDATLIPMGEHHWCENRTDRPCRLVCMMVK